MRRLAFGVDPDPLFADLIEGVRAAAGELGIETGDVDTSPDAASIDWLLLIGRPGRYRTLLEASAFPPRIVWAGEPLPGASTQTGSSAGSPAKSRTSRSSIVRRLVRPMGASLRRVPLPAPLDRRRVAIATERLVRANLEELAMAAADGARLVVTSRDRGATLASYGLPASVVPFGYHARHAGSLTPAGIGARDVALLMLGSRGTHTRRAREVGGLLAGHAGRAGCDLQIVEGVWGVEREALLRRTRVLVDVHRVRGNFVGLRLVLALAAGVVVVTEPMTDPFPFVPGVHYIEASTPELLGVASDLAADATRRAVIVEAGHDLLRGELAMRESLRRVLDIGPAA